MVWLDIYGYFGKVSMYFQKIINLNFFLFKIEYLTKKISTKNFRFDK